MKTPHPQSLASLIALNATLRREALGRARVHSLIPFKREFVALLKKHEARKQTLSVSRFPAFQIHPASSA